jgi:dihydropyrimidinase
MRKILKGGTLITASRILKADLVIKGGLIERIDETGGSSESADCEMIDASGCLVMPGGIDAHAHFSYPLKGFRTAEDFASGSAAAAAGGTTTIAAFLPPPAPGLSTRESLLRWVAEAEASVLVDFCVQQTLGRVDGDVLAEIPGLVREGFPGFKVYLGTDIAIDDFSVLRLMEVLRDCGGQLLVNGGSPGMEKAALLRLRTIENGLSDIRHYPEMRPELIEVEGLSRAAKLARFAACPIYAVHVSCRQALEVLKREREAGALIVAETCPQYLLLSDEKYRLPGKEGLKYTLNPPLRDESNREPLWAALEAGAIQIVASDDCSFNLNGQKDCSPKDFTAVPNGLPGLETRLLLIYNEGVLKKRMSLNGFVAATSTNAAKSLGLYPSKGEIAVGSDADLVILDPSGEAVISSASLHQANDYSPYEGYRYRGRIRATFSRGERVFSEGGLLVDPGRGRLLPRHNRMRSAGEAKTK